jgi:hypothetical protein
MLLCGNLEFDVTFIENRHIECVGHLKETYVYVALYQRNVCYIVK